jgi:hypothetical protein
MERMHGGINVIAPLGYECPHKSGAEGRAASFLVEIKPDLMFYGIAFQSLCGLMVYSISALGFSLKIAARVTG